MKCIFFLATCISLVNYYLFILVAFILESAIGINAILSTKVESKKYGISEEYIPLFYGSVNFLGCLINNLVFIDRISRKINALLGILVLVITLIIMAIFVYAE